MNPFFDQYKDMAIDVMKETGVPASVALAQAALESGYGKHAVGFNFFGIKGMGPAGRSLLETTEYIRGRPVKVQAHFKRYHDAQEAFEDHARIIVRGPLKEAMNHVKSARDFVEALQRGPYRYATDPAYVEKVMKIIEANDLEQFDNSKEEA